MGDDDELREHWRAIDSSRNIARDYELMITTDLFGWTMVERRWGRIGTAGQVSRSSFSDRGGAARMIASIRRRRESGQRRIGTEYIRIQV
ncbi:WGR domain-containing protein [Altericroceibacterium xinjiangense]|uniref:WGR domain-containing protein n=1 Tax=Altericroceibacterium xinjiangense TaxID=762261 RepID=UPI001F499DFA|nr:WGR domain-containing protein [Altericroceibacterium xinjiangense]